MPRSDILTVPFAYQKFTLFERQELSRQANGITRGKSFGSALWRAEWITVPLPHDEALDYEARLNALDGVIETFYAHDLRRPYPRAHADGDFDDSAKVAAVGSDNKSLSLKGLQAGFTISRGDYLALDYGTSRALHQASETVVAGPGGTTALFQVRPHIRPTMLVDTAVVLKKPTALFILVPGSIEQTDQGGMFTSISFQAIQFL